MHRSRLFVLVLAGLFLFSSCRLLSTSSSTTPVIPTLPVNLTQTLITEPAVKPTIMPPTPTAKLLVTQTSTPFSPIQGVISVQNFKLRNGPGFLFDTVGLYDENTSVSIYGRSLGGGWYFVTTPDSRSGWMKSEYFTLNEDITQIPFYAFSNGDLIYGHVRNSAGVPMSGVSIVIWPSTSENPAEQDSTLTDDTGTYYLYLPKTLSGYFTIGENGYNCQSNAVDSSCNFLYGNPSAQSIEIPHPSDISIEFVLPQLSSGG